MLGVWRPGRHSFLYVCSRYKRAARRARCHHVLVELAEHCAQCLSCVLQNTARSASGKGVNVSALTLVVCVQYESVFAETCAAKFT